LLVQSFDLSSLFFLFIPSGLSLINGDKRENFFIEFGQTLSAQVMKVERVLNVRVILCKLSDDRDQFLLLAVI
jgi:hypothetical protein